MVQKIVIALFLSFFAAYALANDQIIGLDADSIVSYMVPFGFNGNTRQYDARLYSGYFPDTKAGTGTISHGVTEFKLPNIPPTHVRSAILQIILRDSGGCGGSEPVILDLYAFAGNGEAAPSDVGRGEHVFRMQGACKDQGSFSQVVDVSNAVRSLLKFGASHIGFTLRPGNVRQESGGLEFYGNNPDISDTKRNRLFIVDAGNDVAKVESVDSASPLVSAVQAPQLGAGSGLSGIASAFSNLLHASVSPPLGKIIAATKSLAPEQIKPQGMDAQVTTPQATSTTSGGGVAIATQATPVEADIVGLQLGMTLDQVKKIIRNHDNALSIAEEYGTLKGVDGTRFLSEITAASRRHLPVGAADAIGVHFPPPPHKSQAIFINRFTGFEEGQQPLASSIQEALIKKYGTPSFVRDHGSEVILIWAFNPTGAQMMDSSVERNCPMMSALNPQDTSNVFFNDLLKLDRCGVTILATMGRNGRFNNWGPLARFLSVYLIDASAFPSMREITANYADSLVHNSASKVKGPKL